MLEFIGAIVVGLLLMAIIVCALDMAWAMICCARGHIRLTRAAGGSFSFRHMVRFALKNFGKRYDGNVGSYYVVGGLEIPPDIRDKVRRSRFYGA